MRIRPGSALAVLAAAGVMAATAAHAAEIGFLEMLFGGRAAAPQAQQVQPQSDLREAGHRSRVSSRSGHRRPSIRYAALPVKIHLKERDVSERQVSIDMKGGAAAAFLKDETLRPGDIVVLKTGARVFEGPPDRRHAMRDFVPVREATVLGRSTRKQLAGLFAPVGALPADEARRVMARMRRPAPAAVTAPIQATAMRVINPWQTAR